MTNRVPTLAECLHAAENMPCALSARAQARLPDAAFSFSSPQRPLVDRAHQSARAGALVIAGDGDATQVNLALLRASELQTTTSTPKATESFSEVVSYLALQMLRADWRRRDSTTWCATGGGRCGKDAQGLVVSRRALISALDRGYGVTSVHCPSLRAHSTVPTTTRH